MTCDRWRIVATLPDSLDQATRDRLAAKVMDLVAAEVPTADVHTEPAGRRDQPERPRIVVLCGSTRFVETFNFFRQRLTYEGKIVLSIEIVTAQDPAEVGPERKALLDRLHRHKIDLADEVLVINPGGYTGESTASEIAYAQQVGRPVRYLEPVANPTSEENRMTTDALPAPGELCGRRWDAHECVELVQDPPATHVHRCCCDATECTATTEGETR